MRREGFVAWAGIALLALGLAAGAAPGLRDPAAQPDGLVLRELPPLARAEAVLLASGRVQFAHEVRAAGDGVAYRRGEAWKRIERGELAGPAEADWHLRPRFWLGTDVFGRDVLSRLLHGARVSLAVGLTGAAVAALIGAGLGLLSGLAGGWIDAALMRITDLVLAIPRLFLALLLVSLWGPSLTTTVLVLGGTTWMAAARLVRGEVLSARERDHVAAVRAAGAGPLRLAVLHLLPLVRGPLIVEGTLRVGDVILLESALSFLGLGVPPPTPSWGNMIAEGRTDLLGTWWVSTFPGLAVALTVVSLNVIGDVLREGDRGRTRSWEAPPAPPARPPAPRRSCDVGTAPETRETCTEPAEASV